MRFQKTIAAAYFLSIALVLLWGCQGNRPLGPEKVVSLNVSIPPTGEVKSALIGTAANEILYRVDGAGVSNIHGTVGPFTTSASSGSIGFALDIPSGGLRVLSVQLNDAATHQPLALGAVGIDLSPNAPVTDVIVVDMGSVTRNCYTLNISGGDFGGEIYTFSTDTLYVNTPLTGPLYDFQSNFSAGSSTPLTLLDAQGVAAPLNTIAYLGNGNFVDFDYVPSASAFHSSSDLAKGAPVSIGDIFCLSLGSIPGGHAWIQVTNLGNGTFYVGPQFRYRVNGLLPYYAYDRTLADVGNGCSTIW